MILRQAELDDPGPRQRWEIWGNLQLECSVLVVSVRNIGRGQKLSVGAAIRLRDQGRKQSKINK